MSSLGFAVPVGGSIVRRAMLFILATAFGILVAVAWNKAAASSAYFGFLRIFLDPRAQIAGLATAVALAFLVGAVHVVHVCYLPAALSALPLVRGHEGKREWLKTALVLTISMVLVTALWGALIGAAGGTFASFFRNARTMAQIMKPTLFVMGLVMLVIALGELGLMRRFLPEIHPVIGPVQRTPDYTSRTRYGHAATLGVAIAGTFGIICTLPPYLALLVYVAVVGSVWYGILALGAYGIGLALPIAVGGFALLPANRSARLTAWLAARHDVIHNVQGTVFAFLGGLVVWYFGVRYIVPPAPHP